MQQLQDESEQLINQLENRLVTLREEHEQKDQKVRCNKLLRDDTRGEAPWDMHVGSHTFNHCPAQMKEYQSQLEEQDDSIYDLKTSLTRAGEEQEKLKAETATQLKAMQESNEQKLKVMFI